MNLEEVNNIKSDKRNLYKKYFKLFLECNADINHRDPVKDYADLQSSPERKHRRLTTFF